MDEPVSNPRWRQALDLNRRQFIGLGAAALFTTTFPGCSDKPVSPPVSTGLTWQTHDQIDVATGLQAQVFAAWGSPLVPGLTPFNPSTLTAQEQQQRMGYNHDFVGYLPIEHGSKNSAHGLLCVSFEYCNHDMMFPNFSGTLSKEQSAISMAAHGMGIFEVKRDQQDAWHLIEDSRFNRRVHGKTAMSISGPVRGHPWVQTSYDKKGERVFGTLNNCSGGLTPWGTWLQAEENFHGYFAHKDMLPKFNDAFAQSLKRYGVKANSRNQWELHDERFDISAEHNEINRFGYLVEIDPYDPHSTPKKRSALGRFKHEAANIVISKQDKVVVYSGDDERFEYVYKFVSSATYNASDRAANQDILDDGTLYVAQFNDDGSGTWLPLVYGHGPLSLANGFQSQADILLRTREAADALGATPMDRPEDIESNPVDGHVFIALTNNSERNAEQVDAANPRGPNKHGHILELIEANDDAASEQFTWSIFLRCGPIDADAWYQDHQDASPLSCPDNLSFLADGTLIVATDGQIKSVKANDGLYLVPTSGTNRGKAKQIFSGIPGGEVCGPFVTPDQKTLFCAVQHPGADNPGQNCSYEQPGSRFPDYNENMPPRPALVAISRVDGSPITYT